jgi:choline dehydrogenase
MVLLRALMIGHPACSAAMGADVDSVLDEKLRVRGVTGLRLAAASILIGEKCADFIQSKSPHGPGSTEVTR